jgi:hypothetical protein
LSTKYKFGGSQHFNILEVEHGAIDNFKDACEDFSNDFAAVILELNLTNMQLKPPTSDPNWYLDYGALAHVTDDKTALTNVKEGDTSHLIKTAVEESLPTAGNGCIILNLDDGINETILYVPSVRKNLFSVSSLADHGLFFLFGKYSVVVLNTKKKVIGLRKQDLTNGLYTIPIVLPISEVNFNIVANSTPHL